MGADFDIHAERGMMAESAEVFMAPRYDIVFKPLFGDERNLEFLLKFLRATGAIGDDVTALIVDPYLKAEHHDDKYGIVDVRASTSDMGMAAIHQCHQ